MKILEVEAGGMNEASRKVYMLGKIESLELIADMVDQGLIKTPDNVTAMARAIRRSCKEQRAEIGMEEEGKKVDIDDLTSVLEKIKKSL